MTQRRKSKKTEAEPRRVNRRTFLAGAGAAACVGAGLWLRRKKFSKQDKTKAEKQPVENPALPAGEWRAVWVSYLEWAAMDFSSADSFRAGCVQMLENCAGLGLNTVLAQVRPFGDALYKSQLVPWSHLCTGVQGQDPGFDPLDILLQEAHGRGLSVEAWLNPYRLRSSVAMPPNLAENNLANTHPEWVCAVGDGLYLNPAEPAAADYVVQGVAELLQNYAVDGIHFDDYFYPTTEESIDAAQFAASGAADLAAWRRQNVTALVKKVRDTVKTADPTLRFGISPQGNPDNDLNSQYSDVTAWLAAGGEEQVVDYLCPQIYWGYGYTLQSGSTRFAFENIVPAWLAYPRAEGVALYFGLGAWPGRCRTCAVKTRAAGRCTGTAVCLVRVHRSRPLPSVLPCGRSLAKKRKIRRQTAQKEKPRRGFSCSTAQDKCLVQRRKMRYTISVSALYKNRAEG